MRRPVLKRAAKWALGIVLVVLLAPLALVGLLLGALNVAPGQRLLERQVASLSGGTVLLSGVSGAFPSAPRIGRIEVRDAHGTWLVIDDAALDWSPLRLLGRDAAVQRLAAARVTVARLPVSNSTASTPSGNSTFQLPVRVDVDALHVGRLELAAPVAGTAAAVSVDGSAHLASLTDGDADVALRALDGQAGSYRLRGHVDPAAIRATLAVREPAHGLVANLAHLPDLGGLSVQASLDGPWSAAATRLAVAAGELRADAHGSIDLNGRAADLDIAASAPAMTPAPGMAFSAVSLDAHVHGPLATPEVRGRLTLEGLQANGAGVRHLTADIAGTRGEVKLDGRIEGLRIPGPQPGLLEASPLLLVADARLDQATRPVVFSLSHPLLAVTGTAQTAPDIAVQAHVTAPDLAPFAAIGGVNLHGGTALDIKAGMANGGTNVAVDGTLGLTGGVAPAPALIGPQARVGVTAALHGSDVTLSRLTLDGRSLRLRASGGVVGGNVDLTTALALSDLHDLAATLSGNATLNAHVQGPTDKLALQADLAGDVATTGVPSGHVSATVTAQGLPGTPTGHVAASGQLDGAPVELAADIARTAQGDTSIDIRRGEWKSAHAQGTLTLAHGATLPLGHVELRMTRLADLRGLVGKALTGSVQALVDLTQADGHTTATATVRADQAGLPGTASVAHATLDARVLDPAGAMTVDAKLAADGVQASGVGGGSARITVSGPQSALAIRVQASARDIAGGPVTVATTDTLDLPGRSVAVSALSATARGETLRLLAPARVAFGDAVAVDRLRLGLRRAVLDVAGRLSPTLDVTASLSNVTADLARIAAPGLLADGVLDAQARLTGTPARPTGTVRLTATGLHLRTGPASTLPPASITANATLAGATARIDARLAAGRNRLDVSGIAPVQAGAAMNLRAAGGLDLALLDPIMAASGRRVRGQVTLDATATGTLAAPVASGSVRLANGEVQDFAQGIRLSAIEALIEGNGDSVRIARLTARAGEGSISASGSVGLKPPMPVDLHIVMAKAKPLASDLLTAVLDAQLSLRGDLQGQLAAAGRIVIRSAQIRVPERLPSSLATLNVRLPGAKPPPPPTPGPDVALNLTVDAPGQIFVRGRGLDAELEGHLVVRGTAAKPQPEGGFAMRRGSVSVAGTTLTFTTGKVGFDGSGKLDPTLDFVASNTTGNTVASLNVGGYASDPKITLSSVPALPQDEVLAHLLFGQSAASLGPFQLAEIAAALAQLTGVGGGGFDPLGSVRNGLGLDRLSVGGGGSGTGASIQAGKYVARGVYVGAKQATSGGGTQAQVQVDLTKRLKLETDIGTGTNTATGASASSSNGTNVGLTYQFEY